MGTFVAWVGFLVDIRGLLAPTEAALDNLAITIGTLPLSVLLMLRGVFIVAISPQAVRARGANPARIGRCPVCLDKVAVLPTRLALSSIASPIRPTSRRHCADTLRLGPGTGRNL